jgi:hypothetical protein
MARENVRTFGLALSLLLILSCAAKAQQQIQVIDYCATTSTVTIPSITDQDGDLLDDGMQTTLLNSFVPPVYQSASDSCPSGAPISGAPDGLPNLVVCNFDYTPQQWIMPPYGPVPLPVAQEPDVGSVWVKERAVIHCAVLYGADCGALGHTADVEGYHMLMIGFDPTATRYDANQWGPDWIETIAHKGTVCEKREDGSLYYYHSLLASKNKHGNYLTQTRCDGSCDDSCDDNYIQKSLLPINVGHEWAPLVTDLGQFRYDYSGENPFSDQPFLAQYGGGAGTIKSEFHAPTVVNGMWGNPMSCYDVCDWNLDCKGCPPGGDVNGPYFDCLTGCDTLNQPRWRMGLCGHGH